VVGGWSQFDRRFPAFISHQNEPREVEVSDGLDSTFPKGVSRLKITASTLREEVILNDIVAFITQRRFFLASTFLITHSRRRVLEIILVWLTAK
jgi:hypothetical protein